LECSQTIGIRCLLVFKRKYLLRCFWLLAGLLAVMCSHQSMASSQRFTVDICEYEPLSCCAYRENDRGIIVEVLSDIASKEGWDIHFVPGTLDKTLSRLETGEIDLAVPVPYAETATASCDFNRQTIISTWAQLYSNETVEIHSFLDLAGRSVGVILNDEHSRSFREMMTRLSIPCRYVEFNHDSEMLEAMQKGWIEVGVLDRFQGDLNAKKFRVRRTSIIFSPVELRLASKKGQNREIMDIVDYHLKKQINEPISTYHRKLRKFVGGDDNSAIYRKMMIWLSASTGFLLITGTATVMLRRQVKNKTSELLKNQQSLEAEIIARRRAEDKYRSIFNNTGTATILIEADMTFSMMNENALRLLGYTRDEIEGKMKTGDFIKGDHFKTIREYHLSRRNGNHNAPSEYETQLINKNGEVKDVFIRVGMIPETQVSIASLIDITEKKRMESQLRQSQKMQAIGILSGGIAHDFNNILAGIMGYAELAISDVADSKKTLKRLNCIITASNRAKELIRQILMFSRQTEQKQELIHLNEILEETMKLIRATTPATIRVDRLSSVTIDPILADPAQIHQIILNLCTNAVHAMGGEVGVLSKKLESVELNSKSALQTTGLSAGRYARLTVADTGHGMTSSTMERIFDPFFTTKKNGDGTGMGLSVVHGIVTRLQGAITVKSELGKGSTFQVYFPVAEKQIIVADIPKAEIPTGSERILLIDDEEMIVDIAGQMLRGLGYKVTTETVSRHAMWTFMKDPCAFDLVISDQTMPGMTGTEMFDKIQSARPNVPFILCTGFSETVTPGSVLEMGIRDLIMKPYSREELAVKVRNVMDHFG